MQTSNASRWHLAGDAVVFIVDDMSAYGKEPSDAVHDSTMSDTFAKTLSESGIAYVALMLVRAI
jgi:hypothetical protein